MRVLALLEHTIHELLGILRDHFELVFIASLYFGCAAFLFRANLMQDLSYWLTSGAMMGAIITLVNKFTTTRYRNGDTKETVTTNTNTTTNVEIKRGKDGSVEGVSTGDGV